MFPNISGSLIENYIQRVTELSQLSQHISTIREVEKIVAEFGIEPDEIEAAQKQSYDHYVCPQGHTYASGAYDAVLEFHFKK
ncbi:hypothetical protein [cyanobacterium endosymbiont of Epithemia turgida]|uniref:hypothetical protein n=1 Tax=cyanobacterium endosymbiont of Epithemia turgida TaxID=718217 RepID=UPI0004D0DAD8|nr:hypothetical protein [cyanobacterium endosymbiont of Epithemia turgida]BAP17106.1 hypothetical protein ETSB_0220 [cyanobacterium endosymbiont of Epithemia turgida isolate EtSB Lake Yunoko]